MPATQTALPVLPIEMIHNKTGFRGPSPDVGKATRFQPGRSPNPGGRPRRKPVTDAFLAYFSAHPKALEKIARAIIRQAEKGNVRAIAKLTDRIEGKVVSREAVDVTVNVGEELIRRITEGHKRATKTRFKTEDAKRTT